MAQWYYARGGRQNGPVTMDDLRALAKAGEVDATSLVWNASMKDWLPAGSVEGIFETSPPAAAGPPAISTVPSHQANPYATPGSSLNQAAVASSAIGLEEIVPGSEPINVMACIKRGFQLTTRNFGMILLVGLIFYAITMAVTLPLGIIDGFTRTPPVPPRAPSDVSSAYYMSNFTTLGIINQVISYVVSLFLSMGLTKFALNLVSGKELSVGLLFSQGPKYLRFLGASILFQIAFWIGLVLLIVPGIYIALRFGQYGMAIVDKDMGITESFKYSSSLTKNNRLNLLGLGVMGFLIVLAGFLALCVGVIFAIPVAWFSMVVAYRWMQYGHRAAMDHPGTTVPMLS